MERIYVVFRDCSMQSFRELVANTRPSI